MIDLFKVNRKNTRVAPLQYFFCSLWTCLGSYIGIAIASMDMLFTDGLITTNLILGYNQKQLKVPL